ncbi:response regulator transcription factor [uncultured Limosilactobacillus sp.]|uniref:winged helix-turn-helix transcriptional regulator n=1 Tax=uncultured Limosilactobacillus sp. TaxID=2837629 RepID=UPI00265E6E86|nr:response regulator transcription factor [uncultured Limosilactobacillus sp.]
MTNKFLLMSQQDTLVQELQNICKKAHWKFELVTTPTGLVVALEKEKISGIWWDMTEVSLDTTIATMTLIRHQVQGPITIFTPRLTERIQRKLYRARVDDVLATPIIPSIFRPLIEQRLWTYHYPQLHSLADQERATEDTVMTAGAWQINQESYTVTKNGETIALTPKEFQLLSYLVDHQGQVLSRDQLVNGVWGYDILDTSRIVDIHISHLRDKLEDDSQHPTHLLTVRGFGYKFV